MTCTCDLIEARITCIKCGYPPCEAREDLGDIPCKCTSCKEGPTDETSTPR